MSAAQYFAVGGLWWAVPVLGVLFIVALVIFIFGDELAPFGILPFFASIGLMAALLIAAHGWAWEKDAIAQLETNPRVKRVLALHVAWTKDNKDHLDFLDLEDHVCSAVFYGEGPGQHRYYFVDNKSIKCHKEVVPSGFGP